jgi:hypothetical protein
MTGFFPHSDDTPWPIDVAQHFLTHCNADVRLEMQSYKFVYNSALASRRPYDQLENLQTAYSAAIIAEANNSRLRTIDRSEVSNANTSFVGASVAETTLSKYASNTTQGEGRPCWGCTELGHVYAIKDGTILCPNKDKPGVAARAQLARKEYNITLKKRRKKDKKRSAGSMVSEVFKNFTGEQLSQLTGDQLKILMTTGTPEKKPKDDSNKTVAFWIDVSCFLSLAKPILPITIDVNLPHVNLAIVKATTGAQFTLSVAYDTCAAVCVGHLDFHLAIAEKLPQLVKSLVWAKGIYAPLTLSGIVSDEDSNQSVKTDIYSACRY